MDNPTAGNGFRPNLLSMTFVLGEYRAIELIGAGGSARVWRGQVIGSGEQVALKVFGADQLPTARREAALAAAVDHPHVVRVLDVLGDDERAVLVTELATGGDLSDLLDRRDRLSPGETLTVLLPLAAALATAHERGIVHGDLSAQNILFDRAGRPLLADLGAGRAAAEGGGPVAATPTDAAPELARGGTPCAATDMFSLGSLALACLTGRHAWPADDLRDVLIQAAAGQWPDPADVDGPPLLIRAVRGLLEHDPDRRPGAATLVMDLRAAGRPEPLDLRLEAGPTPPVGTKARTHGALVIGADQRADGPAQASGGSVPAGPPVLGRGRHGLPVDPGGRSSRIAGDDVRLDLGRVGRARAVTRIRSDTPAPPVPVPLSRLQRVRALAGPSASRPGPGRPDDTKSSRHRAVRIALLGVVTLLVAGLAGAGGLWWARWDRTDPVALDRTAASAVSTTSPASRASATSAASAAAAAPVANTTTSSSPTPTTPAPRQMPRRVTPTASRPGASRPGVGTPARPTSVATQPSSRSAAASPPVSPRRTPSPVRPVPRAPVPADFTKTVRDLDDARARALVARNAALLDAVYTADSAARSVDAGIIASLISGGLRLSGAEHVVRSTRVVGATPLRVEVDDSLPSYMVLDAGGSVVGSTASRAVSARVMVLVKTPAGYRISAVQSG